MGIIWTPTPRKRPKRRRRKLRPVRRSWPAILERVAHRIEQVRRTERLSRRRFAARLGLAPTTYYSMIAARRPTLEAVYGVALAFGVSPRWLLDGHGEQRIRVQDWYDPDQPKEVAF